MSTRRLRDEIRDLIDEVMPPAEHVAGESQTILDPCVLKDYLRRILPPLTNWSSAILWYVVIKHQRDAEGIAAWMSERGISLPDAVPLDVRIQQVLSAQDKIAVLCTRYLSLMACPRSLGDKLRMRDAVNRLRGFL